MYQNATVGWLLFNISLSGPKNLNVGTGNAIQCSPFERGKFLISKKINKFDHQKRWPHYSKGHPIILYYVHYGIGYIPSLQFHINICKLMVIFSEHLLYFFCLHNLFRLLQTCMRIRKMFFFCSSNGWSNIEKWPVRDLLFYLRKVHIIWRVDMIWYILDEIFKVEFINMKTEK